MDEKLKNKFIKKCRKLRDEKKAVTTKCAKKIISQIAARAGEKWIPCDTAVGNIFRANGWNLRKSQKRNPQSDPLDKEERIQKFYEKLSDLIQKKKLKKCNVHMMDETGLYSDSIPPKAWTYKEDKEAYVKSTGTQRRDTLVATIRADGKGFVTFIEHKNQKTKNIKGKKLILQQGVKGMNVDEMKK